MRVGFIGAGKMASALARGFIEKKKILPSSLNVSCPESEAGLLEGFKARGCVTTHSNEALVRNSDLIILATKPAVVPPVLKDIKNEVRNDKLIISIAAGVRIRDIEAELPSNSKVIRVMPNTPSLVMEGATVYALGKNCEADENGETVRNLFSAVGLVWKVQEDQIDAVTGISGSGPCYMYLIIESMADAGVKHGLPRDLAYKLAAQTMVGSGKMILETGTHPGVLKDAVCSPSGSTISALDILERSGLRTSMMQAVEAATLRCHELGNVRRRQPCAASENGLEEKEMIRV